VYDKLWVGGETQDLVNTSALSVEFMFGCQTQKTGLFCTQLSTTRISIPATRLASLPTLAFHFADGVVVNMPPQSYLDRVATDKYMFHVYLTESSWGKLHAGPRYHI
jgi:hypothetical protein